MRAVNLIPAEQRSDAPVGVGRSEGGAYAVLVLAGGLALLAFLYGSARHQVASSRAKAASVATQAQQAQTAAERLAPYTSFVALREQRTQAVDTLVDSRFDWAHVLHEFGRVLPSDASITSLSGTIGSGTSAVAASSSSSAASAASATAVTSATPSGSVPTFTLAGCATSQPAVALTLERLRLIDGVRDVTLESSALGSSSGGGSGGGCPPNGPSFAAQITFAALPSTSVVAASTKSVSNSTPAGSAARASAPTTSGTIAR
jgi:hypothetical protein